MLRQLKWAAAQAFHSSFAFTVWMLVVAVIFIGNSQVGNAVTVGALCAAGVVWLARLQNYCDIYNAKQLVCPRRGVHIEIGHKDSFDEQYKVYQIGQLDLIRHYQQTPFGEKRIYARLYTNEILVIVREESHLHLIDAALSDNWVFYPLLMQVKHKRPTMSWHTPNLKVLAEITTEMVEQQYQD